MEERGVAALIVRCSDTLSAAEFWRATLEKLDFARINQLSSERQRNAKVGVGGSGEIGWKWLAGLKLETSAEISKASSESEVRQRVLAEASQDHLVGVLKHLPIQFIVEDFHYLRPDVQKSVFQQLRTLVDNEISVLVVSTTHHTVDLAYANRDLIGRIALIELKSWAVEDLVEIAVEGFKCMKVYVPLEFSTAIARESVGLPIVTQSICCRLLLDSGIKAPQTRLSHFPFTSKGLIEAMQRVAKERYAPFEPYYELLAGGPGRSGHRPSPCELVVAAFGLDPITFELTVDMLLERITKLGAPDGTGIASDELFATLNGLGPLQDELDIELLEWHARTQHLYVLEPTFLYFLRWRVREQE
jgi:hypothetical protein